MNTSLPFTARPTRLATPFGLSPEQRVLAVYAHPDDEFLTGAALATLQDSGQPTTALYATSGEASTIGDAEFVRAGHRESEAIRALGAYGIASSSQHFLRLPDGMLSYREKAEKFTALLTNAILEYEADVVLTTGLHGYDHPDHRAAHDAAVLASTRVARLTGRKLEVWGLSDRPGEETFFVDPARKLAALALHASQFTIKEATQKPVKTGWTRMAGFDISPRSSIALQAYRELFEVESYVRYYPKS